MCIKRSVNDHCLHPIFRQAEGPTADKIFKIPLSFIFDIIPKEEIQVIDSVWTSSVFWKLGRGEIGEQIITCLICFVFLRVRGIFIEFSLNSNKNIQWRKMQWTHVTLLTISGSKFTMREKLRKTEVKKEKKSKTNTRLSSLFPTSTWDLWR